MALHIYRCTKGHVREILWPQEECGKCLICKRKMKRDGVEGFSTRSASPKTPVALARRMAGVLKGALIRSRHKPGGRGEAGMSGAIGLTGSRNFKFRNLYIHDNAAGLILDGCSGSAENVLMTRNRVAIVARGDTDLDCKNTVIE